MKRISHRIFRSIPSRAGLATVVVNLVCACKGSPPPSATPTAVRFAVVDRAESAGSTRYSAQITAATRVALSFKEGGYVDTIAKAPGVDGKLRILQDGDSVRAGQQLASLRRVDYEQKLGEAQSAVDQAKAAQEQAGLDLQRAQKLASSGSVSTAELDTARIRLDGSRASLEGARVRLAEAQQALADTILRSPLDGIIVLRSIEVGALAAAGTGAFTVAEVRNVKVVFGVPDTVLPRIALGAAQDITTEAYRDSRFQGRITRIDPTADPKSRVFEVEVTIPNEDGRLKTGMIAALSLADSVVSTGAQPLVPLSAIVRSPAHPGQFAVYVVEGDPGDAARGTAHARDVELGDYLGSVIPVTKGLTGGERIVTMGAGLLSDGEAVQAIP
jgi:RND family efflux transporter MFP subunit